MTERAIVLMNFAILVFLLFGTAEGQDEACSNSVTRRRPAILSALSGTIKSPGFPNNYPSPSTCRWKILVPAGKRIRLVFNSFNVENQADCTYDYLQIHDGGADSARSMGRFCGDEHPEQLITSGNMAFLYFKSDTSVSGEGFELQWSALDPTVTVSSVTTDGHGASEVTTATTTTLGIPAATTRTWTTETTGTERPDNVAPTRNSGTGFVVETSGRPATITGHINTTDRSGIAFSLRDASGGPLSTTWYTSTTKRSDIVTTPAPWDNMTMNTEVYAENIICYACEGTSPACLRGEGLEDFAVECRQDEACWVERIGERGAVIYRRSCRPKCTDYWQEEVCMTADGQAEVCSLCCTKDRCNTHVLTGHSEARAPGGSDAGTTVASVKLVSILALTMCLDIMAMID